MHTLLVILSEAKDLLVGYTTDRELHPAPKVDIRLSEIIPLANYSAFTMHSTGQTETH
jgi:hypothetical protein